MPHSDKQGDISMYVALSLTKHINWRTKKLKRKAYVRITEELDTFGVSPYYVGTHGENTINIFLIQSTMILARA